MVSLKPPIVTGISPNEGLPGTQVTIRGENLGSSADDFLALLFGSYDCRSTIRWVSPHKIIANVKAEAKAVDSVIRILPMTKSGGEGSSTVRFRLLKQTTIGPLQECATWIDESRTVPARQAGIAAVATIVLKDDDPLGISDERASSPETFADAYPNLTDNMKLESFSAPLYLLTHHQNASYEDLKAGLDHMKSSRRKGGNSGSSSGPHDSIKSNLQAFVGCMDSLTALQHEIRGDRETSHQITKLSDHLKKSKDQASIVFDEVLGRKDRADATRNALALLQRYKFLFFLPQSIDKNITEGNYTRILNDHTRAMALFDNTEVPLFKEIFTEIDKKMLQFRRVLEDKLVEFPSTLDEQIKIIRLLVQIDHNQDYAWSCLQAYHHWLLGLLWDSQHSHLKTALQEVALRERDADSEDQIITDIPQRFQFAEHVCQIFVTKLQQFWKLIQAYTSQTLEQEMMSEFFRLGIWLIMNAVLPDMVPPEAAHQYRERLVKWPRDDRDDTLHLLAVLRGVRTAIGVLLQQQDVRRSMITPLYDVIVVIRLRCLDRIVTQTIDSVHALEQKEVWKIQTVGLDFSRTQLPDLFEGMVLEVLPLLKQLLCTAAPGEADLFADERRRHSLTLSFQNLVCSFKETLEILSKISEGSNLRPTKLSFMPSAAAMDKSMLEPSPKSLQMGIKDKKILVVLSNCDYCKKYSVSKLVARLKDVGLRHTDEIQHQAATAYNSLNALLMKAYIAVKCTPFAELVASVDYSHVFTVTAVSPYIKDLVLCIIGVRAELFLLSPHFIALLTSEVAHECSRQMVQQFDNLGGGQKVESDLSGAGATQALLDMRAFESNVQKFLDDESCAMLKKSQESLIKYADVSITERVLDEYKESMKLLFVSMQAKDTENDSHPQINGD